MRKHGTKKKKGRKMKGKTVGILFAICACFFLGVALSLSWDHWISSRTEERAQTETEVQIEKEQRETFQEDSGLAAEGKVIPEVIVQTEDSLYTYDQMMEDLETMSNCFPEYLSLKSLGNTADGREIPEVILGDLAADCHLMIQASIHGREYMNTQILMKQLEDFLKNYETGVYEGAYYNDLLNGLCLHLIPMANPDGVTISQMGPEGIRTEACREFLQQCYRADQRDGKEMSDYWHSWKANARGVDLNRNFDVGWESFVGCTHPSSELYKGEAPASEAEVQAILQVQEDYKVAGCMAYHSSGNLIYWDYGSRGEVLEKDRALAQMAGGVTGYELYSTVSAGTDLAGCSDYFVLKLGIPAVTIENGTGNCPLSIEELPDLLERNKELIPGYLKLYQTGESFT